MGSIIELPRFAEGFAGYFGEPPSGQCVVVIRNCLIVRCNALPAKPHLEYYVPRRRLRWRISHAADLYPRRKSTCLRTG